MFSILELSGLPSREASSSPPPPSGPSLHCLSITDHLLKLSPLSVFVSELPCVLAWSSKPNMTPTRAASHAGSWYSGNARELGRQLDEWLACAGTRVGQARAIISPHAGYSYCGDTAAYAYKQIVPEKVERVFILGPSHVVSLSGCALTTCRRYRTPLGDLNIDQQVNDELRETRQFETMDRRDEEAEHSIEMQLPFVAKVMENQPAGSYSIIPVLVGSLATSRQASYGAIFARYISDPHNLFIVSSDFCHWGECLGSWNQGPGSRFHFTPHDSSNGRPIHEQISALDKEGMEAIASLQPQIFNDYLRKTQNTICGRNPICVLLQAAEHFRVANNHTHELRFMKYSQSNQCRSTSDSSVSYAAAALFVHPR